MSDFRRVLDAHVRGQAELADAEQALQESLQREAGIGAAHGALIEALYRGERLSGESYAALMRRLSVLQPVRPRPQPSPEPPIDSADKTILRFVRPDPDISSDKTQFRVPLPPVGSAPSRDTTSASSWSHPSHWTATDAAPLVAGSIIKDRFILEQKIGRGGMGTVFRARDLRKEEAQDRNPYVAVKVLNEDFKRHPRSLQALQREARKAQALQHPNIVTVYDFDRDGTNVYMVMELLEGEPLDRVIKQHKGSGLDAAQAWHITHEICKGMSHAHEQGIVHADFKPANAFLMQDGSIKIFDFGIARAVKQGTRADGAQTAFDPGTLGALTPAYASFEVALGQEPDASDDVYAIACVIYELLTGTHPFNGVSADVASAKGLVAARPAGISGRQWSTLRRALQFSRLRRPASAKVLLEAFTARRRPPVLYASAAVAAFAILAGAVMMARSHFVAERAEYLAAAFTSADARQVEAALPKLRDLDPAQRAALFLNEATRAGLIQHYENQIAEAVNADRGKNDFPQAERLLAELMGFFADSQAVQNIADRVSARKREELESRGGALEAALQRGLLVDSQGSPNVTSALAAVRAVDPRSPLLTDARVPAAFVEQTRKALGSGDTLLATRLVAAGLAIDPGDSTLVQLRGQVRDMRAQAIESESGAARPSQTTPAVAAAVPERVEDMTFEQLRTALSTGLGQPSRTLAQARSLASFASELERRDAADGPELKRTLKLKLAGDIAAVRSRRGINDAIRFAEGAYALFPDSPVLRKSLTQLRVAAAEGDTRQRELEIAQAKRSLVALLDERSVDDAWPGAVDNLFQRLTTSLGPGDLFIEQARIRVAVLYMTRATTLRAARRLGEAGRMLERARFYGAAAASVLQEEQLLAQAQAGEKAALGERDKAMQIEATKQKLIAQAEANEVIDALATLQTLRGVLPKRDAFLAEVGPAAIQSAYLRLASTAARDGRVKEAVGLANRARAVGRMTPEVIRAMNRYARYQAIETELAEGTIIDLRRILGDFSQFAEQDRAEEAAVARWMIRKVVTRANTSSNAKVATRLAEIARRIE